MLRAVFALLFGSVMATAQAPWTGEAAAQLAARMSSLLQRRTTVSLEFQSLATLAPSDSSNFRSALEAELRKAGLEVAAQPEFRVRVTLSENPRGLLFVAESISGENRQVTVLPWPSPPPVETKPRARIELQAVLQQLEPVLDLLLLDDQTLLCLTPIKVSTYRLNTGKWIFSGVATIPLARPPVRDPRGRLESDQTGFHVYLPGTTCNGALQTDVKLTCLPGNESWPINSRDPSLLARWVPDRNLLESDRLRGRFYTAASGLFAAADGRLQDRLGESVSGTEAFGSDLATIESTCGANPVILAAKSGDRADHDEIQAYEIAGGNAAPLSVPTPLAGPVTALWPAETSGQATLVSRNSKTGNYEASRLRVVCAE